jgi:hypothetical protein
MVVLEAGELRLRRVKYNKKVNFMWKLDENFSIKEMEDNEFEPLFQKYSKEFFDDSAQVLRVHEVFSESEKEKIRGLKENLGSPFILRLGVYFKDQFVGWHYGYQESAFKFYMCSSAIFPKYRNRGLYSKMITTITDILVRKGFQEIYSRHLLPNNSVIVPKLKAGFVISGLEVSDLFGSVIVLTLLTSDIRKKVFSYRTGYTKADKEINKYLDFEN